MVSVESNLDKQFFNFKFVISVHASFLQEMAAANQTTDDKAQGEEAKDDEPDEAQGEEAKDEPDDKAQGEEANDEPDDKAQGEEAKDEPKEAPGPCRGEEKEEEEEEEHPEEEHPEVECKPEGKADETAATTQAASAKAWHRYLLGSQNLSLPPPKMEKLHPK